MQLHPPLKIAVAHREAIVAAGILAVLHGRDGLVASKAPADRPASVDLVIADHATAMELICAASRPRILVLTHLDREWDVRVAMEAGVHGYLLQGCRQEQLIEAVDAVAGGAKYVSAELGPKLADCLMRDELTTRELEVLKVMSTGASNKAISTALGIADATVKAHVRAILGKFGACARAEAVVIAAQRGLTSPREVETVSVARRGRVAAPGGRGQSLALP